MTRLIFKKKSKRVTECFYVDLLAFVTSPKWSLEEQHLSVRGAITSSLTSITQGRVDTIHRGPNGCLFVLIPASSSLF